MNKSVLAALLSALFVIFSCSVDKTPVIGISPCGNARGYNVSSNYARSVFRAGGTPLVLPMAHSEKEALELLSRVDGFIMTGGEDVDPAFYGESILNESVGINGFRDTSDMLLFNAARKLGKPVLGTCRGEQIINVLMGGTLFQDLPVQVGEMLKHRQDTTLAIGSHWAYVNRKSLLYELMGQDSIWVNSSHHQAVKDIAAGFSISSRAADGVVESYEGDGVLCTQFHPEAMIASGDDAFLPIYLWLVSEAKK